MIYLDYSASTPLRSEARQVLLDALAYVGNPSSPHQLGRNLRSLVDRARVQILERIGGSRLVFTSGGTEANALVLASATSGPVVVSSIEHDSVLKAVSGCVQTPVAPEGILDLEALEKKLASFEGPGLLSVMMVNNETGVIQPVREAARLAQARGWKIHTDATQAMGHVPVSCEDLGVDFITLSSHKCGGPVGVGALVMRDPVTLPALIRGGGQEYGMRSGTLPAALIVSFAAALLQALNEDESHLKAWQKKIESTLSDAVVYGQKSSRIPSVVCLGMPNVLADLQLMAFDLKGIAISAGAACSSGTMKMSHVLAAMGVPTHQAQCAIRLSMGWATTEQDIDTFCTEWNGIYGEQRLKEAS